MPGGHRHSRRNRSADNPREGPTPQAAPAGDRIEDYALIGDCQTAALVSRSGSIDWLCWPRFDSGACFAALLGTPDNGRWLIAPAASPAKVSRRYVPGTLILETVFETSSGRVALLDFMAPGQNSLVRIVEGRSGTVPMEFHLALRFEFGSAIPWVTALPSGKGISAVAGPDQVVLRGDVALHGKDLTTVAEFIVQEGDRVRFAMTYAPSHLPRPCSPEAIEALEETERYWTEWTDRCTYKGQWSDTVRRSLLTLKALSFAPTGGIVAAATTSLPEQIAGSRNWDYRFCWVRDATFTLLALMHAGYREEAQAWGAWLRRSVAGTPAQVQTLYGLSGERWIQEWEVSWLTGYQMSAPVRVGNAASTQVQLDVYGELLDALYQEAHTGLVRAGESWDMQTGLVDHLAEIWRQPDRGIWEVRGEPRCFTFSRVMAWVAVDRVIRGAEEFGLPGDVSRWKTLRQQIHDSVCNEGFNTSKNCFVQYYGGEDLDASLLLIPIVGFLPAADPRVKGTLEAIERELLEEGFVLRYRTKETVDGLPPGEGVFLACSFWYVDNLALQGRDEEARAIFERLLGLANDVGLLAEEYDPKSRRQLGNFPQAFSHLALINAAMNLETPHGPARTRGGHGIHSTRGNQHRR